MFMCKAYKLKWHTIIIMVLLLIGTIYFSDLFQLVSSDEVLSINNEVITFEEFDLLIQDNRSNVISYFFNEYGIEYGENFWWTEIDGERPIDVVKNRTVNQLVRIKVEQIIFKEYGLIEDISFASFLDELEYVNLERREKLKNGHVIYGPEQYSTLNYFYYMHENRILTLLEQFEDEIDTSDKTLNEYYESIKKERFRKPPYIKVLLIKSSVGTNEKNSGKRSIEVAMRRMLEYEEIEAIVGEMRKELEYSERIYDQHSHKRDTRFESELYEHIVELSVGSVSEIIEVDDSYYVVKCLEREDDKYHEFEALKDLILREYTAVQFEQYIDGIVGNATIESSLTDSKLLRMLR